MSKTEKKIFLDRSDGIEAAVDRLIKASAEKVILNVPRDSVLGSSVNNFQILKRESKTAGKEILVESVDEHILELASLTDIKATNPVFRIRERAVSDILPRSDFKKRQPKIIEEINKEKITIKTSEVLKKTKKDLKKERAVEKTILPEDVKEVEKPVKKKKTKNIILRWLIIIVIIASFLFGVHGLAFNVLPRADIAIDLEEISANFDETVVINSKVSTPVVSENKSIILPGELLIARRNLEMSFLAQGREKIETRAAGKLIIYNSYSSEPQILVASTRFESPTSKIFKLDKRIVVPGASIVNGKIVSSKIEATVTAAEAGEDYNVPSSSSWKIPGLKGTPKYDSFYAESLTLMSGGFIGEKASPTKDDLAKGEEATVKSLKDALDAEMLIVLNNRFKLLDNNSHFSVLAKNIEPLKDDPNKFSVFIDGEMKRFIFEEEALKESIFEKLKPAVSYNPAIKEMSLDYGKPQIDFDNEIMSLPIKGSIIFWPNFDIEDFRNNLGGVSEEMLKIRISAIPGLDGAKVSLWPFWVNWVPQDLTRVNITVE
ncbi:MAG: hypothetical protein QMD50_00805 [Patescibacteria group bacterium]|nr:hypothetical protein [Patescibacteria group bacterium]